MPVPCAGQHFSIGVSKNCHRTLETDLSMSIVERPANTNIINNHGNTCYPLSRVVSLGFSGRGDHVLSAEVTMENSLCFPGIWECSPLATGVFLHVILFL